eukprot:CAMPEP_0195108282 /NCGR_PEP_ID=MMETSP0448-20130528/84498_1 /TAXON_ID=66468 /ORGANISM="Heterocapsa triquestra, Strain CCMP 448" /LENGTH=45 /DNA_ID= /DNA_START= /DNA_END= /DNA_ORIENTATION=
MARVSWDVHLPPVAETPVTPSARQRPSATSPPLWAESSSRPRAAG